MQTPKIAEFHFYTFLFHTTEVLVMTRNGSNYKNSKKVPTIMLQLMNRKHLSLQIQEQLKQMLAFFL